MLWLSHSSPFRMRMFFAIILAISHHYILSVVVKVRRFPVQEKLHSDLMERLSLLLYEVWMIFLGKGLCILQED